MRRKHFLLVITTLILYSTVQSQTPFCGSDWLPADPAVQSLHEQLEQQAFEYFSALQDHHPANPDAPQAVLTIPVVVHIIHDNGPENISDAQVQQAIIWINAAFANTGYFDQGSGAEVGIQFCLAQRTPNGLITNGITRDQSPLTSLTIETQDVALKNLNRWEPKQYLNIWLVRAMCSTSAGCGVAAYAYRPEYHGTPLDGLVIEAQYFGAVQSQISVAVHEVGHYLGLYHTFEGGCTNNNCLLNGDRICDTPPDQSTAAVPCDQTVNTCSTDTQSGFTTDQPDMTSNYLDYGDVNCWHDFTPGQAERMNFYLNGIRHSLLDSKGCLPPCPTPVVSAFTPDATTITTGQTINFTNTSQNAGIYQWSANGVPFSTTTNSAYTFAMPGTYTITLLAQGNNTTLCDASTSQIVIQVVCAAPATSAFTTNNTAINTGQTVVFTNTSQNADTWQWSVNGTPFSTAANTTYTFLTPGTYTVSLVAQASNTSFCNIATSEVVIQVTCAAIANFTVSNQYPAENELITLTNTSQHATIFSWTINGVAQVDTLTTLTFAQAGTYTIQLTASDGVCQSSAEQIVSVQDSCTDKTFQYMLSTANLIGNWRGLKIISLADSSLMLASQAYQSSGELRTILTRFNTAGTQLWSREIVDTLPADSQLWAYSMTLCATPDGGFIVTRRKSNPDNTFFGQLIKFSIDGSIAWSQSYKNIKFTAVKMDFHGHVIALGYTSFPDKLFFVKLDLNGNLIWNKSFVLDDFSGNTSVEQNSFACLPNGDIISSYSKASLTDPVVFRLDSAGTLMWAKYLNTGFINNFLDEVLVVFDSTIYLTGTLGSPFTSSTWATKITTTGQALWSKRYFINGNSLVNPYFSAATTSSSGGLILAGIGIAEIDANGHLSWQHNYQSNPLSSLEDISPMNNGSGYLLTGAIQVGGVFKPWMLKTDVLGFAGDCPATSMPIQEENVAFANAIATFTEDIPPVTESLFISVNNINVAPTLLCEKTCPKVPEICDNNIDDDGDGLFDCLDTDCPCVENACQSKRNNHWYFGTRAGLDFSTEPPTVRSEGQTNSFDASATISDNQGNLLFYTDGLRIFNRFHQVMPNGSNTIDNQARITCLIIPYPDNPALYCVFISDQNFTFQYAVVDMRLDNGKGDVIPTAHFVGSTILNNSALGITATRSCRFNGYWLAAHNYATQKIVTYQVNQNGVSIFPVSSPTGDAGILGTEQMKFSPDGQQLARVGSDGLLILYDFDLNFNQGGSCTNPQRFKVSDTALHTRGVEYSPNGQYLYVSGYKEDIPQSFIYQFDLKAGDITAIANSRVEIATDLPLGIFAELQLAPNGKIYISNTASSKLIDVIHQPNAPGLACQYQKSAVTLPSGSDYTFGFSNCISSDFHQPHLVFSPDAPDSICILNSPIDYAIRNVNCDVDSIHWSLVGTAGTITANYQYASVTYFGPPGQGQLIATAFTACGLASDTLPVTVRAGFNKNLNLGPDRTVCDNGVFTFNAGSGFVKYRWQDGSTDSVLTTLLPGKYWVDVFDNCGNRQTDTVTVSIAPTSVLSLGPDLVQCAGLPTTFQRPAFFAKWQWSPAVFLSCDTCASITVDPSATTTWMVIAQTTDGCLSLDTLHWQIVDTLFVSRDTLICASQTIDLYGIEVPADTTVHFLLPNIGPGCDTLLTVQTLGLETPAATLQARICPDQFFPFQDTLLLPNTTTIFHLSGPGCDSVVTVEVAAFPSVTASLPADTSLSIGANLTLNAVASGTGPLSFDWQPSTGLDCTNCLQPVANPLDTITYTLLVTDENGCAAHDSITLRVSSDCQILIPNAFTPNSDGINDWFYPVTFPCVRNVRLWRVVNRWGEVVFERRNFEPNRENLGWDGHWQGKEMPSEVLVWMAELEYFDGRIEQRQGEVMLLR